MVTSVSRMENALSRNHRVHLRLPWSIRTFASSGSRLEHLHTHKAAQAGRDRCSEAAQVSAQGP